ncbi:probable G-protein coupled receptor 75 [Engraulis encrasicolus]|uniref:probable G-protein coupled receptor 75 n=1 Tax=Engraulis encrasicolus TaxID=184585 RepID=UPI002FD4DD29
MCTMNSTAWPLDLAADPSRPIHHLHHHHHHHHHHPLNVSMAGPGSGSAAGQDSLGDWALIHSATLACCSLLLLLIFSLGSYGNLVVFLSFFDPAFRKFRTNFDFMILNLSFCDLFLCCVTAPMFALVLFLDASTGGGGVSRGFCFAFHLSSSGFIIMSLETVAVIALHRLRMVLGQQPNRTASFPCTIALTALLWTSSFALAMLLTLRAYPRAAGPCLPHFGLSGVRGGDRERARVVLYVYLADFAFCVAVVAVSYLLIAHALRKNAAQVRKCPAPPAATAAAAVITVDTKRPPPQIPPPFMATGGLEAMQCPAPAPVHALYRNQNYNNKFQQVQTHPFIRTGGTVGGGNDPTQPPGAAHGATSVQLVSSVNLATAKDSKAVATCVAIVVSVLLCCLPMAVTLAQDRGGGGGGFLHYQLELCGLALVFLKSGINPFVYSRNSAGLRRRVLSCLHWGALWLLCGAGCCCKHRPRLLAVGKGSLEAHRNKSSHHDTNSAYVLSPKPQQRRLLVDQACGPGQSHATYTMHSPAHPGPRAPPTTTTTGGGGRKPRPPSTSTPINTRIEPYYSIYNSSPSAGPSSPSHAGLQPVPSSTTGISKSYMAMHYHTHQHQGALQDLESTTAHQQIPAPSV